MLHNKYYVWSSQRPVLYRPLGARTGWRLAGGTVDKLYWKSTPIPVDTIFPDSVTLSDFQWVEPARSPAVKPTTKRVQGSKGAVYVVTTLPTGKQTCTCPGFSYRRFCKHTNSSR
jgi:hypothetical protein